MFDGWLRLQYGPRIHRSDDEIIAYAVTIEEPPTVPAGGSLRGVQGRGGNVASAGHPPLTISKAGFAPTRRGL